MSSKNLFPYCPLCGQKQTIAYINNKCWKCSKCNFELFHNVAAAAGIILYDNQSNVLFEVRSKEPKKGMLSVPGGFTNPSESIEETALRECEEEIGVKPEQLKYICSFPNIYEYSGFEYNTCDVYFCAEMSQEYIQKYIKIDKNEVKEICFKKIEKTEDIYNIPIAFESLKNALKIWLEKKNNHI